MAHAVVLIAALALWLGLIAALRNRMAHGSYSPEQLAGGRAGLVVLAICVGAWAGGVADAITRLAWSGVPHVLAIGLGVLTTAAVAIALARREYTTVVRSGRRQTSPRRLWQAIARSNASRALIAGFVDCAALALWAPVPNGGRGRVPAALLAAFVTLLGGMATVHWWRSRARAIAGA